MSDGVGGEPLGLIPDGHPDAVRLRLATALRPLIGFTRSIVCQAPGSSAFISGVSASVDIVSRE